MFGFKNNKCKEEAYSKKELEDLLKIEEEEITVIGNKLDNSNSKMLYIKFTKQLNVVHCRVELRQTDYSTSDEGIYYFSCSIPEKFAPKYKEGKLYGEFSKNEFIYNANSMVGRFNINASYGEETPLFGCQLALNSSLINEWCIGEILYII